MAIAIGLFVGFSYGSSTVGHLLPAGKYGLISIYSRAFSLPGNL